MIIPSKQVLLVGAAQSKELFIFDPKTACTNPKYSDDNLMNCFSAYYQNSQQFIVPHLHNSFINVWDADAQTPTEKISVKQNVTSLSIFQQNILVVGTKAGTISLFELPSGILLRRVNLHSGEIISTELTNSGFLITVSKNQASKWRIKDILTSKDKPIPQNSIHLATPIKTMLFIRGLICLLTQKQVKIYDNELSLVNDDPIRVQSPTCMCSSQTSLFIGNNNGKIKQQVLFGENELLLDMNQDRPMITMKKPKNKQIDAKKPLTSVAFVNSLNRLISGSCEGEIKIWVNGQLKNSLHLFKSAITQIKVINRPSFQKKVSPHQKIKTLHKYELNTLELPLIYEEKPSSNMDVMEEQKEKVSEQQYLDRMLEMLNDPSDFYEKEIELLRKENQKLLEANLFYGEVLGNGKI